MARTGAALTPAQYPFLAVFDLWEKREIMGAAMRTALDTRLRNHHAFVAGFQVLSLTIPAAIQNAIEVSTV